MIRFLADQDFNERILKGLSRADPAIDLIRARQIGLAAAGDRLILERAAAEDRVLATHDRQTMVAFAQERVATGKQMPGVLLVARRWPSVGPLTRFCLPSIV